MGAPPMGLYNQVPPWMNPFMFNGQAGLPDQYVPPSQSNHNRGTTMSRSSGYDNRHGRLCNTTRPDSSTRRTSSTSGTGVAPQRQVNPPVPNTPGQVISDSESDSHSDRDSAEEDDDQDEVLSQFQDDDTIDDDLGTSHQAPAAWNAVFSKDRIDPIIKAAAVTCGLEFVNDTLEDNSEHSLQFGGIGFANYESYPRLHLPKDIRKEKERQAKTKWHPKPFKLFDRVFRVPRQDYDSLFTVPIMDPDVTKLLPKQSRASRKAQFYSAFWEHELISLDAHLKCQSRIAAFQLVLLNHLVQQIGAQDDESDREDDPSSSYATARLITDMAAQLLRSSLSLSLRTISLRRENACAHLRKKFVNDLPTDLSKLPFSDSHVFGSALPKTVRGLARKIRDNKSLESSLAPLSSNKGKGKGRGSGKKQALSDQSSSSTYQKGRGRGSKSFSTGTSNSTPSQSARGRSHPKKGRGRGAKQSNS